MEQNDHNLHLLIFKQFHPQSLSYTVMEMGKHNFESTSGIKNVGMTLIGQQHQPRTVNPNHNNHECISANVT